MYIFIKDYKDVKKGTVLNEDSALWDFRGLLIELGVVDNIPKEEPKLYSGKWYINHDFDLTVNDIVISIRKSVCETLYFDNTEIENSEIVVSCGLSEQQKESICENLQEMNLISREPKKYIEIIAEIIVDRTTPYGYSIKVVSEPVYVARFDFKDSLFGFHYKMGDIIKPEHCNNKFLLKWFICEKSDDLIEYIATRDFRYYDLTLLSKGKRFLGSKDYVNENAKKVSELENEFEKINTEILVNTVLIDDIYQEIKDRSKKADELAVLLGKK